MIGLSEKEVKYDPSVSMAKGIAIILMVLGHIGFSDFGGRFIYMFHMPLFFILSGYCFKESYLNDFLLYARRRLKGAWWPYVKWGLLFLTFHNVLTRLGIYGNYYTSFDFIKKGALVMIMNHTETMLGGYWFLHDYLIASFVTYAAVLVCKDKSFGFYIFIGLFLLMATILMRGLHIKIPGILGTNQMFAAFFMFSGFIYRKIGICIERFPACIPLGAIIVVLGALFWSSGMVDVTLQTTIPYLISAFGGFIMVFSICYLLAGSGQILKMLTYVGDRTLSVLTWHFLSFKLVSQLIITLYGLPKARLTDFPTLTGYSSTGWCLVYLIVGVSLPLLLESFGRYIKNRFGFKRISI